MRRLVLVNDEALGIFQRVDESQVFFLPPWRTALWKEQPHPSWYRWPLSQTSCRWGGSPFLVSRCGDSGYLDDWNISGSHQKWQRLFLKEKRMPEPTRVFWDVADQFPRLACRAGSTKFSSCLLHWWKHGGYCFSAMSLRLGPLRIPWQWQRDEVKFLDQPKIQSGFLSELYRSPL